jgi:hypothetical protein
MAVNEIIYFRFLNIQYHRYMKSPYFCTLNFSLKLSHREQVISKFNKNTVTAFFRINE